MIFYIDSILVPTIDTHLRYGANKPLIRVMCDWNEKFDDFLWAPNFHIAFLMASKMARDGDGCFA